MARTKCTDYVMFVVLTRALDARMRVGFAFVWRQVQVASLRIVVEHAVRA